MHQETLNDILTVLLNDFLVVNFKCCEVFVFECVSWMDIEVKPAL